MELLHTIENTLEITWESVGSRMALFEIALYRGLISQHEFNQAHAFFGKIWSERLEN